MATAWQKSKLIAIPRAEWDGIGRSVLGYAAESIVIGRALACGYGLFFRAWRDYKCDAILDYRGETFRVEIKGTGEGKNLSVTSGGRSGTQISRAAESRAKLVSKDDVDFIFGVHTLSGRSWIIPIDVVQILGSQSLNLGKVEAFEESWGLFLFEKASLLGPKGLRESLLGRSESDLERIATALGIVDIPMKIKFRPRLSHSFSSRSLAIAFAIWLHIGNAGKLSDD